MASARGESHLSSQLYERACDWTSRSRRGDRGRRRGAGARDGGGGRGRHAGGPGARARSRVTRRRRSPQSWPTAGTNGGQRALLEAGGHAAAAARLWERAGRGDARGRPPRACGAIRRAQRACSRRRCEGIPRPGASRRRLGALLARFGKDAAAVRVLQRVPEGAPERREALVHLVPALERLGLDRAAADASAELAARGGAPSRGGLRLRRPNSTRASSVATTSCARWPRLRARASSSASTSSGGERVAVKVFAAWDTHGAGRDALARFEREVRTMRALDHPSIVPYRDYVAEGPAIVLAWMAGGTLERMLATTGALAPARAVEIVDGRARRTRRGAPPRDPSPRREARRTCSSTRRAAPA